MGETAARAAKREADNAAIAAEKPTEPTKERGHARGQTDDRRLRDNALRGVPLVGAGQGAIAGTVPGPGCSGKALEDEARELNEHARLIVQARMKAARQKLRQPGGKP